MKLNTKSGPCHHDTVLHTWLSQQYQNVNRRGYVIQTFLCYDIAYIWFSILCHWHFSVSVLRSFLPDWLPVILFIQRLPIQWGQGFLVTLNKLLSCNCHRLIYTNVKHNYRNGNKRCSKWFCIISGNLTAHSRVFIDSYSIRVELNLF